MKIYVFLLLAFSLTELNASSFDGNWSCDVKENGMMKVPELKKSFSGSYLTSVIVEDPATDIEAKVNGNFVIRGHGNSVSAGTFLDIYGYLNDRGSITPSVGGVDASTKNALLSSYFLGDMKYACVVVGKKPKYSGKVRLVNSNNLIGYINYTTKYRNCVKDFKLRSGGVFTYRQNIACERNK